SDFYGLLDNNDVFGVSVAGFSTDLNGDGDYDIMVGARNDDDGGDGRGSFYVISLSKYSKDKKYSKLYRELDGSHYITLLQDRQLRFRYDGEYGTNQLKWNIYGQDHEIIASSDDTPAYYSNLYTNGTSAMVGENLFTIDLSCQG